MDGSISHEDSHLGKAVDYFRDVRLGIAYKNTGLLREFGEACYGARQREKVRGHRDLAYSSPDRALYKNPQQGE